MYALMTECDLQLLFAVANFHPPSIAQLAAQAHVGESYARERVHRLARLGVVSIAAATCGKPRRVQLINHIMEIFL